MHMNHITSDRGDDLEGSTRMAEYERESMIRLCAYYLAEHRGFAAGHEIEDWLTAEREWQAIESARAKTGTDSRSYLGSPSMPGPILPWVAE
jgi:hypothetical protein